MYNKIKLYINTVKYLKPSQIYYRLRNRANRRLYKKGIKLIKEPVNIKVNLDVDLLIPELDYNKEYLNRFATEDILNDKFTFISITNKINLSEAWNDKGLQQLWRYNLHYFEYLFKLAHEYSISDHEVKYYHKFKYLIENWIDNNIFPFGDGWHPYTISLRITNWISVYKVFYNEIKQDDNFNKKFKQSLYLQYKYLQSNLEKDVLGNHYFENIKALLIGSIFLEDIETMDKFKTILLEQLREQILEDGLHFELSPMYHKIILEDLIKITYWLKNDPICKQIIIYLQKMIDVTYSLEEGFGKTPAFNDSADGVSKDYEKLLEICELYFNLRPEFKSKLEHSGFYIIKDSNTKLIFDTGDICPTYLPAHGHCDALSFELAINGKPVIVNSGTYCYINGEWRNYFRSTRAHNTVMISGQEQSHFWGSFRVASRIKKVKRKQFNYKGIEFYAGSHITCHGELHKRFIGVIGRNKYIVLDCVRTGLKDIESFIHFYPGILCDIKGKTALVSNSGQIFKITAIGTDQVELQQGWYSDQFNIKREKNVLVIRKRDYDKAFFGYILDINSNDNQIFELENKLKILTNEELVINYDELGALL